MLTEANRLVGGPESIPNPALGIAISFGVSATFWVAVLVWLIF